MTAKQLSFLADVAAVVMFAGFAWTIVFGVLTWNGYFGSIVGDVNKPATMTFFLVWLGPTVIAMVGFYLVVTRMQAKSAAEKLERAARGESEPVIEPEPQAPVDLHDESPEVVAVPDTASPQMQAVIGRPLSPIWNDHPKSAEEWKVLVARRADEVVATLPDLRKRLGVKVEPTVIVGVKAYVVTPEAVSEANRNRLLVHVHGGGYVFGPGESGTREAILMAGYGQIRIVSVDYRMPPDFPYPAAMDDAMAVWKEVTRATDPKKIAIFGTSTGGGMTLAMVLRAKKEGLPLPAATAPGTPWSDMTKTGDTYFTNEMLDNVLVSNDGWLGDAAKLYANGHDLKDPMLSPVYGDFGGFPPTILTSGTRDLFLSNTVRVHRRMRAAGVDAELHVFEGQSHAQYAADPYAPETKDHFGELSRFFDEHLAK